MTLVIYGRKSSPNVQKICWLCKEGEIKVTTKNVGGIYGGLDSEEFKKLNPNSTFPVINDNGFILYESNTIIKYISEKHEVFKTNDLQNMAKTNQWIDWSSLTLGLQCAIYRAYCPDLPEKIRDNRQLKKDIITAKEAKDKINFYFKILNNQLHINQFMIHSNFGLADIAIGCWIHRCRLLEIDISEYKRLEKWFLKLNERKPFISEVILAPLPPN